VGSDAAAVVSHTRDVVYLDDGDYAALTSEGFRTFHLSQGEVSRSVHQVTWELADIEKCGFEHFMLKEIFDQPNSLRDVMRGRLLEEEGDARLGGIEGHQFALGQVRRVVITACGTSWHAGLVGEYMLEELARVSVSVEYASEFRYRNPVIEEGTLVLAVSQSGETADTMAALRLLQQGGQKVLSVVNVPESSMARASDGALLTVAGPEIGVASTKAFTAQLALLACLAIGFGRARGTLDEATARLLASTLTEVPGHAARILEQDEEIREMAVEVAKARDVLFLGRGALMPIAMEGALKLKELSYIHAEGYPAGEMKHGPIALIDSAVPVIALCPSGPLFEKTASNLQEAAARGGRIMAFTDAVGAKALRGFAERVIVLPTVHPFAAPILHAIPVQVLAYHVAVLKGTDVDQPRNLAKSVTVE